jgi:two-component system response regulator FixJ
LKPRRFIIGPPASGRPERIDLLASRCVYVVDDDRDVRSSISFMLGTADIESRPFADGEDFLDSLDHLAPGCVLLDIRMPKIDGFQVMAELERHNITWPVVVMTGHGEVPVAVRAMKMGAVDFIEKPFGEELLLASLDRAFLLLKDRGEKAGRERVAKERIALLTSREREVLQGLVAGLSNKLIARRLDISLRTVEMHRANMMDRLQVAGLAEALTLAVQAEVSALDAADANDET